MQDAYPLNIKLQGIEVTSGHDPHIAQVKDSDFGDPFIPPGGLPLCSEDEAQYQKSLYREREHQRRVRRQANLGACERLWESSVRCLREERHMVLRRKGHALKERRRMEIEVRRTEREARKRGIQNQADTLVRSTRQLKADICSNQRTRLSFLPTSANRSALCSQTYLSTYAQLPPLIGMRPCLLCV